MKRILLLTTSSAFLYLILTSSSFGPAGQALNATGSPGSNTSCGNCHSGGGGLTTGAVEIRKLSTGLTGPLVTQYMPDTTYIIKIVGNNATLNFFGFQLTALNNSNATAGSFAVTNDLHMATVSQKSIVEHASALPKINGHFIASFNWTAPAAGTGMVTFYGIVNAVNGNNQQSGDKPGTPFSATLSETAPTGINELSADIHITTYPNPVTDKLNISIENAEQGTYLINVLDISGKMISTHSATVSNTYSTSINTSSWASGIYHLQLKKGNKQKVITVMK